MVTKVPPSIIEKVGFEFDWSNRKVWALDVPIEEMSISKLSWHFGISFWNTRGGCYDLTPNQVILSPKKWTKEYQRILKADLRHPIDIMFNKRRWLILDGLHRLVKAKIKGKKKVRVRKIPLFMIPLIRIE